MDPVLRADRDLEVGVENIGGIDEASVTLSPGVTVLEGRNATNRTSLLRAIAAALGTDDASLKAGADAGSVTLTLGEDRYERRFERRNGTVVTEGTPLLEDPELADLFAVLLATNEARLAVETDGDLREVIMRPVDVEDIRARIDDRVRRRDRVDDELADLDEMAGRLPDLEARRQSLRAEIDSTREALAEKTAAIEDADRDVDPDAADDEYEERLGALHERRSELESIRERIESERESIEALTEERADLQDERADVETSATEIGDLGERIGTLQERKRRLDSELDRLGTVVQFNQRMLDGDGTLQAVLADDGAAEGDGEHADHVTSRLLEADDRVCWTCGTTVEESDIEATLEEIRTLREERREERREVVDELDDLRETRKEIERTQQRRQRIDHRLERIADELDRRRETIRSLQDDREDLRETVDELESTVASLERDSREELLSLHREANRLEFELGDLEDDLADVQERIESVESALAEREDLEAEREALTEEITDLRNRIDTVEAEAVEAFNEHMAAVLDVLDYGNVARVWLERKRDPDRRFELHVVREADDTVHEDTIANLSESEREVTGLVFALAGYLVHDVHETVPVLLLDSLEAIDADRIDALVDYLRAYAPRLVVALLPGDAAALSGDYARITDI